MAKAKTAQFTLRYYSTRTAEWHEACVLVEPRLIVKEFDRLVGKVTVPTVELVHRGESVLRLGLQEKELIKLAVQGCRLQGGTVAFKERYAKLRARGVGGVKGGRNRLLDAMVV